MIREQKIALSHLIIIASNLGLPRRIQQKKLVRITLKNRPRIPPRPVASIPYF